MRSAIFIVIAFLIFCGSAAAQVVEGAITLPAEFDIRDAGWSQLANVSEMLQFLLAVMEAMVMTAILAFHPQNRRRNRSLKNWEFSRSMFLFALIGLAVGFLVIHHGVLIGFVVFGLGGLFRFRMENLAISETAQMISVALIGLAVGLDLPVMALLLTIAAAAVLAIFSRKSPIELEIKFDAASNLPEKLSMLTDGLQAAGFATLSVTKSKFKPVVELAVTSSRQDATEMLATTIHSIAEVEASGIEDWHVSS